MGNACKGNLLRLQSCFLVVESFSVFHVKRWLFFVVGGCFTWNMEASVAGKMIQLLSILMYVTISWRFGKASCMVCSFDLFSVGCQ